MKPAKQWSEEFLNQHILNVRGNEFEQFVKNIQVDARRELLEQLSIQSKSCPICGSGIGCYCDRDKNKLENAVIEL